MKPDVFSKLFPGLDPRTHDRIAHLLPGLGSDPSLRDVAQSHGSPLDADERRNGQAVVLAHIYATMVGSEPDDVRREALREVALRGSGEHAAVVLLHAFDASGADGLRAAVDSLLTPDRGAEGPSRPTSPPDSNQPPRKDSVMAIVFTFDLRNIPRDLATKPEKQTAYVNGIKAVLELRGTETDKHPELVGAVIGSLLRSGQFDPNSGSIPLFVQKITENLLIQRTSPTGTHFTGEQVYQAIAAVMQKNATSTNGHGHGTSAAAASTNGSGTQISYQLFSFVGEEVLKTIDRVPLGDPNFPARVQSAILDYASGAVGYEDLDLPSLETDTDTEIVPENIQACGMMYAAYQLEMAKLIPVLDMISDLYDDGLIPIVYDDAGQALDDYRFNEYQRISAAKRAFHFARLFGMKGADVPKTVQPNTQFDTLLMRFASTVAEYERVRDLAQTWGQGNGGPGGARPGAITSEHVRKSGRELAANLSLYGWGSAHTVARRLNQHIKQALNILGMTQVQQAFGASNVWHVVERVCQQELRVTPNIVKYRTMADAGKKIVDVIARNPQVWKSADKDVFEALGPDKDILLGNARYWLTVNGVTDSSLDQLSQNVDMVNVPSLPTMGGASASSNGALNQIRSMISAGQTPSLDQLQHLLVN
ncbi:hypothetical protein [Pendulispora albinea]|uniref:Uncharacterized protein n=1 Tax=Pendulispora albinea TaxID=2741071 RepID=A0ABZ2M0H6_9BACT